MATWEYEVPEDGLEVIVSVLYGRMGTLEQNFGTTEDLTRCRDCQMHAKTGMCLFFGKFTRDDDYCSQAKRKDLPLE